MAHQQNDSQDYKRIARNTLMLYARFALTLFISLFTSRVVLQALGFNDFGLYNVVGGFVSLLAFMNGYISEGTSRFITFAIGEKNEEHLKNTFSGALALHVMMACLILIAAETAGLWYVENKFNIQAGREDVALFVYQLSIITCVLGVMQIPFSACIMAHEDMESQYFQLMTLLKMGGNNEEFNRIKDEYLNYQGECHIDSFTKYYQKEKVRVLAKKLLGNKLSLIIAKLKRIK